MDKKMDFSAILSREFHIAKDYVDNIIALIDEGNTIPFIARYRKEKTGSCDDQVLRELAARAGSPAGPPARGAPGRRTSPFSPCGSAR